MQKGLLLANLIRKAILTPHCCKHIRSQRFDLFVAMLVTIQKMAYKLFQESNHAQLYSLYRPTYPRDLINFIIDFTRKTIKDLQLMVDVGCGSGQSTTLFAKDWTRLVGVDISHEQIKRAIADHGETYTNIQFTVGQGEKLPVTTSSVDLVACGQSAHWLDRSTFFSETDRVLKPGGTIALFGYSLPLIQEEVADAILNEIYSGVLGAYWSGPRKEVDRKYKDIMLPYTESTRKSFTVDSTISIKDLVAYISSWSAWQTYTQQSDNTISLQAVTTRFMQSLKSNLSCGETIVRLQREYFLLIGRKPIS